MEGLPLAPGSEVAMPSPTEVGGTVVKKEVFMDMDVPAVTPRGGARAAHPH